MKSLLLLTLGGLCGVIATVLFFTVDTDFGSNEAEGAGGGNITIVLTEEALSTLIAKELAELPGVGDAPLVEVTVGSNGVIRVVITVGGLGVGFRSRITVNPEIVDGKLVMEVVDAALGEIALPDEVAGAIERPLNSRLEQMAGGLDYRVTAIRTTDHRLAIEIQV